MEEQIDTEMKKMDELDDDDIEKIRQRRLKAMQKAHQAKQVIFTHTLVRCCNNPLQKFAVNSSTLVSLFCRFL